MSARYPTVQHVHGPSVQDREVALVLAQHIAHAITPLGGANYIRGRPVIAVPILRPVLIPVHPALGHIPIVAPQVGNQPRSQHPSVQNPPSPARRSGICLHAYRTGLPAP